MDPPHVDYNSPGPSAIALDLGGGIGIAVARSSSCGSSLVVSGNAGAARVSVVGRSGPVRYGVSREALDDTRYSFAIMRGGEYDVIMDGRVAATVRPLERHVVALARP